jgi:hypothetical protein
MWRRVDLAIADVSEEHVTLIFRLEEMGAGKVANV